MQRSLYASLVAAILLVLAAGWLYLFTNSRSVNASSINTALSQLKDIKQLDSNWSVDVLKSQADINKSYDPLTHPLVGFSDLLQSLSDEAAASANLAFVRDIKDIEVTIDYKADLIDRFKAQNALLKNSLRYVPTANKAIQDDLRSRVATRSRFIRAIPTALYQLDKLLIATTSNSALMQRRDKATFANLRALRKKLKTLQQADALAHGVATLVSLEENLSALVGDVFEYNSTPDPQAETLITTAIENTKDASLASPASVRDDVNNLMLHLAAIVLIRTSETQLLRDISQVPVSSKIDALGGALTKRFDLDLSQQFAYQRLLLVYSAVTLVLVFGSAVFVAYRSVTERRRLIAQVETTTQELREMSLTDSLTGLRNRRFLQERIDSDVSLCLRGYDELQKGALDELPANVDLIFYMVDIDHFKEVNDTYGHSAGDMVLLGMQERLKGVTRDSDYLIRWGGEEFLIVARGAKRDSAEIMAERIRSAIACKAFELPDGTATPKTCSIGFACFPFSPEHPRMLTWGEVVQLADHELFRAKNHGRNAWAGFHSTKLTHPDWTLQALLRRSDDTAVSTEFRLVHSE